MVQGISFASNSPPKAFPLGPGSTDTFQESVDSAVHHRERPHGYHLLPAVEDEEPSYVPFLLHTLGYSVPICCFLGVD